MYTTNQNRSIRFAVVSTVTVLFFATGVVGARVLKAVFRPSALEKEEVVVMDAPPGHGGGFPGRRPASAAMAPGGSGGPDSQAGGEGAWRGDDRGQSLGSSASADAGSGSDALSEGAPAAAARRAFLAGEDSRQEEARAKDPSSASTTDSCPPFCGGFSAGGISLGGSGSGSSGGSSSGVSGGSSSTTVNVQSGMGFSLGSGGMVSGVTGGGYKVEVSAGAPMGAAFGATSPGSYRLWLNTSGRSHNP